MAVAERYFWQQAAWSELSQVAVQGRLSHAYLLAGDRGLGKYQFAKQFIAGLMCPNSDNDWQACGQCKSCMLYQEGSHMDVYSLSPNDQESISVDDIRALNQFLQKTAVGPSKRKAVLINHAENMTVAASNALLKTLEEPTAESYLLLISSDPNRLLATVKSRCQKVVFKSPSSEEVSAWLGDESADLKLALALHNNAPLAAQNWQSGEGAANSIAILSTVHAFLQKKISLPDCAQEVEKFGVKASLELLWLLCSEAVKLNFSLNTTIFADKQVQPLASFLAAQYSLPQLFQLMDDITKRQRLIQQHRAINSTLLLESVFYQFYRLGEQRVAKPIATSQS